MAARTFRWHPINFWWRSHNFTTLTYTTLTCIKHVFLKVTHWIIAFYMHNTSFIDCSSSDSFFVSYEHGHPTQRAITRHRHSQTFAVLFVKCFSLQMHIVFSFCWIYLLRKLEHRARLCLLYVFTQTFMFLQLFWKYFAGIGCRCMHGDSKIWANIRLPAIKVYTSYTVVIHFFKYPRILYTWNIFSFL